MLVSSMSRFPYIPCPMSYFLHARSEVMWHKSHDLRKTILIITNINITPNNYIINFRGNSSSNKSKLPYYLSLINKYKSLVNYIFQISYLKLTLLKRKVKLIRTWNRKYFIYNLFKDYYITIIEPLNLLRIKLI